MGRPRSSARGTGPQITEKLLLAAECEFGGKGFEASRLEDIARRVGISRPSLLYHFKTKEALYRAVVRRSFADLDHALTEALGAQGDFAQRLDLTIQKYLEFLRARPAVGQVVLRELAFGGRSFGYRTLFREVLPILRRVERFVKKDGRGTVRESLPIRQAILQVVVSALVGSASGPFSKMLWGGSAQTRNLVRTVFLEGI